MIHIEGQKNKPPANQITEERITAERKSKKVKAKEVARKIKSFDHFIYLWGEKARYYPPPKRCFTWHYISQLLAGEKKLLKIEDVGNPLELPKCKGIFVDELWIKYKENNGLSLYFPDMTENHQVPRTYFFNVKLNRFFELSSQNHSKLSLTILIT
jgi:hypothetical protein